MGIKKYLISIFLIALMQTAIGQGTAMHIADSISTDMYNSSDWNRLILFGVKSMNDGNGFTDLRLRVAYAYFISGNYKKALSQYYSVLSIDSFNSTARYYAYFCNIYLNNDVQASYNIGYEGKEKVKGWLSQFGLVNSAVESGVKENNDPDRDNSYYNLIALAERLGWNLQLDQSLAYFSQDIFRLTKYFPDNNSTQLLTDEQKEYYAKLSFALNSKFILLGAYHYLDTKLIETTHNNNLGLLGLKYTSTYADIQADVNFGNPDGKPLEQYDGKLLFYPLGNLNLYTISTASAQHMDAANHFIFDQALGFRILKNTWLEASVTVGNQDNYLAQDGLYIYNGIDNTTFKSGATLFYELNKHALLQLNYFYERKDDSYSDTKYDQNSTTLGLLWKF
jgi:hypothetical protein